MKRNIFLWYVTTFFTAAEFTLPIWVIFNTTYLSLNYTEAMILGMLPFGISALLEIPTGSFADKYGRLLSYRSGLILQLLAMISYIFFKNFSVLIFFQIIGGLGLALKSGSLEALIHNSITTSNKKEAFFRKHSIKMIIVFISRTLAVLVGSFIFAREPRLPFIFVAVSLFAAVIISFFFQENKVSVEKTLQQHMKKSLQIILTNNFFKLFIFVLLLYIFIGESMFSFYQPYFKSIHIPLKDFGLFYAVISSFSALGSWLSYHIYRRWSGLNILVLLLFNVCLTIIFMLFENIQVSFLAIVPSSITFGFIINLRNATIQNNIKSKYHSTAISIVSFAGRAVLIVGTVLVGVLLDHFTVHSINILLAVIAVVFFLVAYFVARSKSIKLM